MNKRNYDTNKRLPVDSMDDCCRDMAAVVLDMVVVAERLAARVALVAVAVVAFAVAEFEWPVGLADHQQRYEHRQAVAAVAKSFGAVLVGRSGLANVAVDAFAVAP